MGVKKISDLVSGEIIELSNLSRKKLAVDAFNIIYQFLASIRGYDGSLLTDLEGKVTSHLSGLLYRNAKLLQHGINLAYIFDGEPSKLKREELRRRAEKKQKAIAELEEAKERGDMERVQIVAKRTSVLTKDMIKDAKKLLELLGIPVIDAPQDGEAQAAYMAQKKDVWAVASQDFDSLLFGAPSLVRNLTLSGRRKLPRSNRYITVNIELYNNFDVLKFLKLTREQLVDVGILIGTDFNPDGVKGVGPKTAYKFISKYGSIEEVLKNEKIELNADYQEIREIFLNPTVTDDYSLEFRTIDVDGVIQFMCEEHNFDKNRVMNAITEAKKGQVKALQQKRLDSFFGK